MIVMILLSVYSFLRVSGRKVEDQPLYCSRAFSRRKSER